MSHALGITLAKGEKNSARLELRLPPSFLRRLEDAAEREGLSVASYIRSMLKKRMDADDVPEPESSDDK